VVTRWPWRGSAWRRLGGGAGVPSLTHPVIRATPHCRTRLARAHRSRSTAPAQRRIIPLWTIPANPHHQRNPPHPAPGDRLPHAPRTDSLRPKPNPPTVPSSSRPTTPSPPPTRHRFRLLTTLNTQTPTIPRSSTTLASPSKARRQRSHNAAPQPATCNLQPATPESCYRAAIAADPASPPHCPWTPPRPHQPRRRSPRRVSRRQPPHHRATLKAHTLRALARSTSKPNHRTPPPANELLAAIQLTSEAPATRSSPPDPEATPTHRRRKAYRRTSPSARDLDATSASPTSSSPPTARRSRNPLTKPRRKPRPNQQDPPRRATRPRLPRLTRPANNPSPPAAGKAPRRPPQDPTSPACSPRLSGNRPPEQPNPSTPH